MTSVSAPAALSTVSRQPSSSTPGSLTTLSRSERPALTFHRPRRSKDTLARLDGEPPPKEPSKESHQADSHQCLSAVVPLGTRLTPSTSMSPQSRSPMPFGSRPSRDNKRTATYDLAAAVTNAFRQSSLSGLDPQSGNFTVWCVTVTNAFRQSSLSGR